MATENLEEGDLRDAGLLLQFGLRPLARPASEPTYRQLLARYDDFPDFRIAVHQIAEGLGLRIAQAGRLGLALVPTSGSVFTMKWNDYRAQSTEDRLIDAMIYIGIMTTVFPRSEDLEEDTMRVRPLITIDEVEDTLRTLCVKLEEETRRQTDLTVEESQAGLYEAWRTFHNRPTASETQHGRRSPRATRALIERALEFLTENGFFVHLKAGFQATWRYHVFVQDFSAQPLYAEVQKVLCRQEK